MTLPDERYRAIAWAERFLKQVANPRGYPRVPSHVREEARSILRHFPSNWDLDRLSANSPDILQQHIEPVTRLFMAWEDKAQHNDPKSTETDPSNEGS
jgi:hypothetical protein